MDWHEDDCLDDFYLEGTSNVYSGFKHLLENSVEVHLYLLAFNTLRGLFSTLGFLLMPISTRIEQGFINNQIKHKNTEKCFIIPDESNNQRRLENLKVNDSNLKVKDEWICPITKALCDEPVSSGASHKNYYEKQALEQWLTVSNEDPVTREIIVKESIVIDKITKEEIETFLEENEKIKKFRNT